MTNNLKPWKPGQSGNPSGRPALPESLRAIASLTQDEVTKIVSKWARMTRVEHEAASARPETSMLELSIAKIFDESAKRGDFMRLGFLLDRAGLKPKPVEADGGSEAEAEIRRLSDNELRRFVKEILLPELEKTA